MCREISWVMRMTPIVHLQVSTTNMRLNLKSCLAGDAIGFGDSKANVGHQSVHWKQYSFHCSPFGIRYSTLQSAPCRPCFIPVYTPPSSSCKPIRWQNGVASEAAEREDRLNYLRVQPSRPLEFIWRKAVLTISVIERVSIKCSKIWQIDYQSKKKKNSRSAPPDGEKDTRKHKRSC
jgi:hypothetical protein